MDISAFILAGGRGTRFHPYTELFPKPMIPVGEEEKPVLEYIVEWLSSYGVRDIVLLVGHRWRYIYNYFGDGSRFGVKIKYSLDEEDGYNNTGGAILKAIRRGLTAERFLIWYGDILATVNVKDLLEYHASKNSDVTLVVTSTYKLPVGVAEIGEDMSIHRLVEKPEINIYATVGIGVAERKIFESDIEASLGKNFDFMGDFIPFLIKTGRKVYAYIYKGEWWDVGSLERYKKIDMKKISKMFNEKKAGLGPEGSVTRVA